MESRIVPTSYLSDDDEHHLLIQLVLVVTLCTQTSFVNGEQRVGELSESWESLLYKLTATWAILLLIIPLILSLTYLLSFACLRMISEEESHST